MAVNELLIAAQATSLEPTRVEGEPGPLTTNLDGRLRVASKPGYFPPSSADLTVLNAALTVDVTDASNVIAHVKNTGSAAMAAGTFVFEASIDSTDGIDGTWFVIQGVRTDSNTVETSRPTSSLAAGAGQLYAWEFSVNAVRWFRIRCSVAVTASSIARWTVIRGTYATEPIPAIQTHPVSQSGTFTTTPVAPTAYSLVSAATTNAAVIKSAAGSLYEISVFNPTAAVVYVKLYSKGTAPVPGTDVPVVSIPVAVNGLVTMSLGELGKRFASGIGIAITAGPLATDAVAVAAGVQVSASYI